MDVPPEETAEQALTKIRRELDRLTREYASGALNATQFNALYRHFTEKRTLIERVLENNPDSDAWKQVAQPQKTAFLRDRFESRPLYYVVFKRGEKTPLVFDGKLPQKTAEQVHSMLQVIWSMQTWRTGLARKAMGEGMWMLLYMGENALTLTVYFLQPSTLQTNLMKELHDDFERANRLALVRNLPADRMVFPQRALLEK